MFETFKILFSQSLLLFCFIAIGYTFRRTDKLPAGFNKGLSNLLVWVFLPFLIFNSMAKNFRLEVMGEKLELIWLSLGLMAAFFVLAAIFSRVFARERSTRDVYRYSFLFPNSGYIGNPLVLLSFGELMLFDFMILCIPFMILTYTYGVYILNPNRKFNLRSIFNPAMVALLLGMAAGLLELRIPTAVQTILDTGADCMAPAAMILTGVVFASNNLKTIVSNAKVYLAVGIKIVLIPLVVVWAIAAAKVPYTSAVLLITMVTLPTGLNSIVYPEAYGGDSRTGAQLCFVSTLTSLVFMPLIFAFHTFLCG